MSKRQHASFDAPGRKSGSYWPVPSTRNVTKGVSILSVAWLLYALGSESQRKFVTFVEGRGVGTVKIGDFNSIII